MPDYRIICSDLDGTLLDDGRNVTDLDRFWIRKVVEEKGVTFAIASGRMYESASEYLGLVGVRGPAVCYNGGCIYGPDGEVLDERTMDQDLMAGIIDVFHEFGQDAILFSGMDWFVERKGTFTYEGKRSCYRRHDAQVVDDLRRLNDVRPSHKILSLDHDHKRLENLQELLVERGFPEGRVHYFLGSYYFEVMPSDVNKGSGIERLARSCGVDISQVIAFGDDYNDVEMLETAGLGIAMGNSFPGVASHAKMVTDTNNNGGIAKAIRRIFY